MPLILTKNNWDFSKIIFSPRTAFKAGQLGAYCDFQLFYQESKLEELEFKAVDSYAGNLFEGSFHGQGVLKFKNNDEYQGNFMHGRKQGKGFYVSAKTGNQYDCIWEQDLLHGECFIRFASDDLRRPVNIGDFEMGFNEEVGKEIQKKIQKSYLAPLYENVLLKSGNNNNKFDVEGMVILAF
jgi:hypothetical protein